MATNVATLLWKIVAPLFFTIGTVGNILSIVVLTRRNTRKTSTAVYLTALSLSDLIVLNTGMVRWWLIHMFKVDVRHFGDIGCRIHWFFLFASTELSSWLLVAVTCERITSTIWPHKVRVICTHRSALSVILCLFIVIYGGSSHLLFGMRLKVVAYEEGAKPNVTSIATSPLIPVGQVGQMQSSRSEFSGLNTRSVMDQVMLSASTTGEYYFSSATFPAPSRQTKISDDVRSSTYVDIFKQTSPVQIAAVQSSTEASAAGPSEIESTLSVTTVAFNETSETFTATYKSMPFSWNTITTEDTSWKPSTAEESTTSLLTSAITQPITNATKRYTKSHITVPTSNFPRLRTEDTEISVEERLLCFALSDVGYSNFFNFVYPWMDLLLYFLVPAVILCIGEIIIVRKLIASNRLRRRMCVHDAVAITSQRTSNRRASVTIMLMTVNAVFILCTTPISIFLIGMPYWVNPELGLTETQQIIWAIVNLLMYLNHSINFVLYFLSGSRFRSHVYKLFRRNPARSAHTDRLSFSQKDTASEEASIQRQLTLRSIVAASDKARKVSELSVRGSYTRKTSEGRRAKPSPKKAAKLLDPDYFPKAFYVNNFNNNKESLHEVRVTNEKMVVCKRNSVTITDESMDDTMDTETPSSFIKGTNSVGHLIEGFGEIHVNDIDIITHI